MRRWQLTLGLVTVAAGGAWLAPTLIAQTRVFTPVSAIPEVGQELPMHVDRPVPEVVDEVIPDVVPEVPLEPIHTRLRVDDGQIPELDEPQRPVPPIQTLPDDPPDEWDRIEPACGLG